MIASAAVFLGWWAGILAVILGASATLVWARFASKVTDPKVKSAILYCTFAIALLTLSEAVFVKQSFVIKESASFSPEVVKDLERLEYLRYSLIASGFIMLVLAANTELDISRTYTFIGSRFKNKKTRSKGKSRNKRQAPGLRP